MSSPEALKSTITIIEVNHCDISAKTDYDDKRKMNDRPMENNNTPAGTGSIERPTFISTKTVICNQPRFANGTEVTGTAIHTIPTGTAIHATTTGTAGKEEARQNGEQGTALSHVSSKQEGTKTQKTNAEDRSKKETVSTDQEVIRSLDQVLDDDAGRQRGVERTFETLPSPRPVSLSVSKEKILRQQSTPTSPITPIVPHPTAVGASTEPLESPVVTPGSALSPTETPASVRSLDRPPLFTTTHFVVAAIDFGTTMSGYAFSFVRDPSSIHMMRKWEGGDPGIVNQKTPTTLLLNPEGDFHSFGFTARDYYHDLDSKEAKRWFYFEKFKMSLHYNATLNKETTITASNGKTVPALKVFCHALRYFKDHALQELSDQSATEILSEDIRWVITVPAIWKAPAKQFMREAAYQAGIASVDRPSQLLIALEPEAASIYVRRLRVHQLLSSVDPSTPPLSSGSDPHSPSQSEDASPFSPSFSPSSNGDDCRPFNDHQRSPDSRIDTLQENLRLFDSLPRQQTIGMEVNEEGTRYMVVDCGGGTVDITVHEMEAKNGHLHELHKATGGPFGSVGVDLAFENLLSQIFGSEFIETYKAKRPAGWVDLMIAFESRKRAANPHKTSALNVSLPFSFIEYYKKSKGSPVESAINKHGDPCIRWSSQGMLRLAPEAMKRLFHSTLERIKQAIGDVLNTVKDIKYLFLVGGFAESPILQHEIRRDFSHILKILIPQDVALTILKGAVCFGLDPTVVTVRRSRLTYGVEVLNRFDPDKHPKSKRIQKDGSSWCTEVFDVFVTADQPMARGDTVVRKYAPAKTGQKTVNITVYSSEKTEVRFVTDPGVTKCGTLKLCLADVETPAAEGTSKAAVREIQALMTFGDTEIKVDAVDVTTGTSAGATIDFLSK